MIGPQALTHIMFSKTTILVSKKKLSHYEPQLHQTLTYQPCHVPNMSMMDDTKNKKNITVQKRLMIREFSYCDASYPSDEIVE